MTENTMPDQPRNISRDQILEVIGGASWLITQGWEADIAVETAWRAFFDGRTIDQTDVENSSLANSYQGIALGLIDQELGERAEMNWDEARDIIYNTAKLISEQVQATSKHFKIDVATGRRLLAGQNP